MSDAVQQPKDMRLSNAIDKLTREAEFLNMRFAEEIIKFDMTLKRMFAGIARSDKYLNYYKEIKKPSGE